MIVSIFCVSPVWVIAITKRNVCLFYRHKKLVTVNIHSYIEWGIVCIDHLCCLSAFSEAKDDFPFYLPDIDWEALTFSMICKTKLCPLTTLVLSSQNENAFFFFSSGVALLLYSFEVGFHVLNFWWSRRCLSFQYWLLLLHLVCLRLCVFVFMTVTGIRLQLSLPFLKKSIFFYRSLLQLQ